MSEEQLRMLRKLVEVYRQHGESSYAPSQAEVYFALRDAMPVVESIVEQAKAECRAAELEADDDDDDPHMPMPNVWDEE